MKTRLLHFAALVVVTVLVGYLDYLTGDELDLFILYFIPIAWAAWRISRAAAVGLSVLSGALWFSANIYLGHAYTQPMLGLWGEAVMFTTFIACALATSRIRMLLDHERILNTQLADALAKVKKLSGRLPICLSCKSIQDETGGWQQIEEYFTHQSEDDFVFAQRICPHCLPPESSRETVPKFAPLAPALDRG